jgi:quinol monooxygenase YgiN
VTTIVIITARIAPGQRAAFEDAYRIVAEAVKGTPGHVRDILVRDEQDEGRYMLLAEWTSRHLFHRWADDPGHMRQSAPMYPYWADSFERHVYEVRVATDAAAPASLDYPDPLAGASLAAGALVAHFVD